MTLPHDIPQDVRADAESKTKQALAWLPYQASNYTAAITRLLAEGPMAERKRCTAIADEAKFDEHALAQATDYGRGKHAAAIEIAAAIRGTP